MVSFNYTINNTMGLHARPVGLVVKAVNPYKNAKISIIHGEKKADAKRMFAVMALQIKQGDTITITVEDEQEQEIASEILSIFQKEKL